jgi:hypothetical protein
LSGAVVDAVILGRAVAARSSARPFRLMAVPLVLGLPAAVLGGLATRELGNDLVAGLAGGSLAALAYLMTVFLLRRETFLETGSLLVRSMRAGMGRERPAALAAG